jgi:hypothetical protein
MDIRAFGSVFGQTSVLPYASGYAWQPSDGEARFPTTRAIFVEAKSTAGTDNVFVEFNDGQGQMIEIQNLDGNSVLPFGVTAVSGGSVQGVIALW